MNRVNQETSFLKVNSKMLISKIKNTYYFGSAEHKPSTISYAGFSLMDNLYSATSE